MVIVRVRVSVTVMVRVSKVLGLGEFGIRIGVRVILRLEL